MRAAQFTGDERIEIVEAPEPRPGPGEVPRARRRLRALRQRPAALAPGLARHPGP